MLVAAVLAVIFRFVAFMIPVPASVGIYKVVPELASLTLVILLKVSV